MRTFLPALAIAAGAAAALSAAPAQAVTFSKLTTIYIASGVFDSGGAANTGVASSVHCSNVSGVTASVRFVVYGPTGAMIGNHTTSLAHAAAFTASTRLTTIFPQETALHAGAANPQGTLMIEATQSGVFCTAMVIDAATASPNGVGLHLVRVNPHPGTLE